jgi:rSAM/selenodomain-associated transferase 1
MKSTAACAIGVMARAPSAAGKTRLAPHLSEARLAALRVALLADALGTIGRLSDIEAFVFFSPDEAEPEVTALMDRPLPCVRQGDGDLGQRMLSAIGHLIDRCGYDMAMLVGADIPLLGSEHVAEARDALQASGLVLGPADDGGYYLIGMTKVHAGLFAPIAWGTDRVLTDTLSAAFRLGIEARLIRGAYDIDTMDDLRRLDGDLAGAAPDIAPHVRRWLRAASDVVSPRQV